MDMEYRGETIDPRLECRVPHPESIAKIPAERGDVCNNECAIRSFFSELVPQYAFELFQLSRGPPKTVAILVGSESRLCGEVFASAYQEGIRDYVRGTEALAESERQRGKQDAKSYMQKHPDYQEPQILVVDQASALGAERLLDGVYTIDFEDIVMRALARARTAERDGN